jgi:Zn-dependent protease/CBS domain-containing protein
MKWSFRIARVSGIDIRVHLTFALIVAYFALTFSREHGGRGALFGAVFVCCLFLCVLLHELGHSWVAQAFGVSVREILLLPIGGVARLGREPERPIHELLIALAGPLVNVVIAALLLVVAFFALGMPWLLDGGFLEDLRRPSWSGLLGGLLWGNVMVAVFNMIPALPMDGGRVFRALLAMMFGKRRATSIAATVGQVLAVGIGLWALNEHQAWLTLIAMFVFFGATQERASGQTNALLSTLRAGDAVNFNTIVLSPGDVLATVAHHSLRSDQSHFPVVHGERLIGVLSREDALRAMAEHGGDAYVARFIQRRIHEVDANLPLDEVRNRILENDGRPVVVRGIQGYLGLLSFEDMSRAARVASRLERSRALQENPRRRSASLF